MIFFFFSIILFASSWVKIEIYFSVMGYQFKGNAATYLTPDIIAPEGKCVTNDNSKIALKDQVVLGPDDTDLLTPRILIYNENNDTITCYLFDEDDVNCSKEVVETQIIYSGVIFYSGYTVTFFDDSDLGVYLKYTKIEENTRETILGFEIEENKWCVHSIYNIDNDETCKNGNLDGNFSLQMYHQNNVCKTVRKKTNIYSGDMNYYKSFFTEDYFAYGFYGDSNCTEESIKYYLLYFPIEKQCLTGEVIFQLQQSVYEETPEIVSNEDYDEGFIEISIFIGKSECKERGDCCGGAYEEVKWVQKIISPLGMCVEGAKILYSQEDNFLIRKNYNNSDCSGTLTTIEKILSKNGFDKCTNYEYDIYIQQLLDWYPDRTNLDSYFRKVNVTKEKTYYYYINVVNSLSHLEHNAVLIPVPKEKCSKDEIGDDYTQNFRYNYISNPDSCENEFIGATNENSSFKVDCTGDGTVQIKHYNQDYCKIYEMENISFGETCYEAQLAGESGIYLDSETDYNLFFWVTCLPKYCYGKFDFDSKVCSGHGVCKSFNDCDCEGGYNGDKCDQPPEETEINNGVNVQVVLGITIPLTVLVILGVLFSILAVIVILIIFTKNKKLEKSDKKLKQIKNVDVILEEQEAEENSPGIERLKINKSLFVIDYKDVKLLRTIGAGGSGATIYYASWNGTEVAFKVFQTMTLNSQNDFDAFEKEVQIQSGISHPNILRFFGCSVNEPRVGIVMEYCANGDLESYVMGIKDGINPPLDFSEKLRLMLEIGLGMEYLHKNQIIHRDLKCQNVLLDKTLTSKVIDFGLSKIINKSNKTDMTRYVGTQDYMSPEILSGNSYSYPADVFSFSILMYCLYFEKFQDLYEKTKSNVTREIINFGLRPLIPPIEEKEHEWFFDLMKKCWKKEPKERPTFSEIVQELKLKTKKL